MDIQVKCGVDIPMEGEATGVVQAAPASKRVALDVSSFDDLRFSVLVGAGDSVKRGQPLVMDKAAERVFVSPGCGKVVDIVRGLKRRLLQVVIEVADKEEDFSFAALNVAKASREDIREALTKRGAFLHIRMRPFACLASPKQVPGNIFIKALESAPLMPCSWMQVSGYEAEFQAGLDALAKLTSGKVHLVHSKTSQFKAYLGAKNVERHTASGPHPSSHHSVHIQKIAPITSLKDCVWTLDVAGVVTIGSLLLHGKYHTERVVAIAGTGFSEKSRGFFKTRLGSPISDLIAGRLARGSQRVIVGDVLTGRQAETSSYLGPQEYGLIALPENTEREMLHFFQPGLSKYTATRTYMSAILPDSYKFSFTTNQHGEERAFIDSSVYDAVMPLRVPTSLLVKALLTDNYEHAVELGLLEVAPEDFALPTFICPSKIEMQDIVAKACKRYAAEMLG